MVYTKQTWANLPSKTSAISAARLSHMEDGIGDGDVTNPSSVAAVALNNTYGALNPVMSGFTYDGNGNCTAWTENGVSCSATYDGTGNIITLTTGAVTLTFTYDSNGNLIGAS